MLERLTDTARAVITSANEESEQHGRTSIGASELLLALLRRGVGQRVLKTLGAHPADVRSELERLASSSEAFVELGGSSRVIELARHEANSLGHNYIGTEHLLIALVAHVHNSAARALADFGVSATRVREEVLVALASPPGDDLQLPRMDAEDVPERWRTHPMVSAYLTLLRGLTAERNRALAAADPELAARIRLDMYDLQAPLERLLEHLPSDPQFGNRA